MTIQGAPQLVHPSAAHGRVQPDRLFDYFVAYMDLNYICGPIPRRLFDRLRARYERRAG